MELPKASVLRNENSPENVTALPAVSVASVEDSGCEDSDVPTIIAQQSTIGTTSGRKQRHHRCVHAFVFSTGVRSQP